MKKFAHTVGISFGRCLAAAGYFSCAYSWVEEGPALQSLTQDYINEVRNHTDRAGADLLSCQLQSMILEMPGIPTLLSIALDPSSPVFSPVPLGRYDGYVGYYWWY